MSPSRLYRAQHRRPLPSTGKCAFLRGDPRRRGLLQAVDARAKVLGLLALIVATTIAHRLGLLCLLWLAALLFALFSQVRLLELLRRVWLPVLAFTVIITLPAIFTTPGRELFALPRLHLVASEPGLRSALRLLVRVETTASLAALLVLCTPWMRLLRALRWFGVPREAIVVLGMSYRYIFLLLEMAREMFLARRSRMARRMAGGDGRKLAAANAGILLQRTLELSQDVHLAMLARGFRGDVFLLDERRPRVGDYLFAATLLAGAASVIWMGRIG